MRFTFRKSRLIYSSRWSRRKQAEMLDEWQNQTLGAQIAANQLRHRIAVDIESRPESENVGSFGVNAKPLSGQFSLRKRKAYYGVSQSETNRGQSIRYRINRYSPYAS